MSFFARLFWAETGIDILEIERNNMSLTFLPQEEFLKMFHKDIHEKLVTLSKRSGVSHLVCVENQDMWSSHFGQRTALAVGPGCTHTIEAAQKPGFRLGDVPSRFQYPVAYTASHHEEKKVERKPARSRKGRKDRK